MLRDVFVQDFFGVRAIKILISPDIGLFQRSTTELRPNERTLSEKGERVNLLQLMTTTETGTHLGFISKN